MIKLFAILLISLGSFLEIYYYAFRFTNDGIETWLSIIIGITLTLLLCLAILNRKKKGIMFLILTLIIYSVMATSAGQSFSLSLVQKEEIKEDVQERYRQEEITETQYRINQIDDRYIQIQNIINEASTLEDRYEWKNTLAKITEERETLNNERLILKDYLSELRTVSITHNEIDNKSNTNIYAFYNTLTNIPVDWLQFLFQTWLSIFIAIMAPLGITTLQAIKPKEEKKPEIKPEKKPDTTWIMLIEKWVYINWFGVRSKKSNTILNETNFFEYTKAHGKEFPKRYYNRIKAIAIKTKCIKTTGIITNNNEPEVIGKIVNYISKTE